MFPPLREESSQPELTLETYLDTEKATQFVLTGMFLELFLNKIRITNNVGITDRTMYSRERGEIHIKGILFICF